MYIKIAYFNKYRLYLYFYLPMIWTNTKQSQFLLSFPRHPFIFLFYILLKELNIKVNENQKSNPFSRFHIFKTKKLRFHSNPTNRIIFSYFTLAPIILFEKKNFFLILLFIFTYFCSKIILNIRRWLQTHLTFIFHVLITYLLYTWTLILTLLSMLLFFCIVMIMHQHKICKWSGYMMDLNAIFNFSFCFAILWFCFLISDHFYKIKEYIKC